MINVRQDTQPPPGSTLHPSSHVFDRSRDVAIPVQAEHRHVGREAIRVPCDIMSVHTIPHCRYRREPGMLYEICQSPADRSIRYGSYVQEAPPGSPNTESCLRRRAGRREGPACPVPSCTVVLWGHESSSGNRRHTGQCCLLGEGVPGIPHHASSAPLRVRSPEESTEHPGYPVRRQFVVDCDTKPHACAIR